VPDRPDTREFSPYTHGGEEFLVLKGIFEDEHGEFPAGGYVRNPPTSRHTPSSPIGCILFVKLWQFDSAGLAPAASHEVARAMPLGSPL
jgi:anti-sigma factor ChrR (cupin superfamily)